MTVNDNKTQLLCVSPAIHHQVNSYIEIDKQEKIMSQSELKQLGFHFSDRPTVTLHLEKVSAKFRSRLWFLRHLKKAEVDKADLVHVYKCFLVPILDYASVVYHPIR